MSDNQQKNFMSDEEYQKESRRNFVRKLGIIGGASVAGGAALVAGMKFEDKKNKDGFIRAVNENNELITVPKSEIKYLKPEQSELQRRGREGLKGRKWVMVIDLAKCRNARKCVAACQSAHQLRPYEYHINTLKMQEGKETAPYYMPKPCQHCDNPPCTAVCPVNATFKRQDGIVLIDNERCIGCRFCIAACPYSARMFHWGQPKLHEEYEENEREYEELMHHGKINEAAELKAKIDYDIELNVPQKKGTISKCLFSADRLREGKMPYCVSACPNGVFYFGDENEDAVTNGTTKETVRLKKLLRDNAGYRLLPELGTQPRVYYLPPKNRLFDFPEESILPEEGEHHS